MSELANQWIILEKTEPTKKELSEQTPEAAKKPADTAKPTEASEEEDNEEETEDSE